MLIFNFRQARDVFGGVVAGVLAGIAGWAGSWVFWAIVVLLCVGTAFYGRNVSRR